MSSVVDVIVNPARFILPSYVSRILKSHEVLKVYFTSLSVVAMCLAILYYITLHYSITLHYITPFTSFGIMIIFQPSFSV